MDYRINTYVLDHNLGNEYRFVLGYDPCPLIVIGAHPSTADNQRLDPTVGLVSACAKRHGFDGFLMLNVYPYRSPKPENLPQDMDRRMHLQNLRCIEAVFRKHPNATVLVAYGDLINERQYLRECFADIVRLGQQFNNLQWKQIGELTRAGNPRQFIGASSDLPLQDFQIELYRNVGQSQSERVIGPCPRAEDGLCQFAGGHCRLSGVNVPADTSI